MADLGSFGAAVPGAEQGAVSQAIDARQTGAAPIPALDQTLTGSPVAPTPPQGAPLTPQLDQAGEIKPQVQNAEVEIILKALTQRLSMISKLENPPVPSGGGGTYGR